MTYQCNKKLKRKGRLKTCINTLFYFMVLKENYIIDVKEM